MNVKSIVEIVFTKSEVESILVDAAPKKFVGWEFSVDFEEDGSVILTGSKE